eukprot:scaffold98368_cov61-Phaeocystis_antarctica.AAC.5
MKGDCVSCSPARLPAWARSPSAVGRCPLTCEEEEAPDWLANSPKGQVPLKLPAASWSSAHGSRCSAVVGYPPFSATLAFQQCNLIFHDDALLQVSRCSSSTRPLTHISRAASRFRH